MNFTLTMMNFTLKMMNFTLKMMDFTLRMMDFNATSAGAPSQLSKIEVMKNCGYELGTVQRDDPDSDATGGGPSPRRSGGGASGGGASGRGNVRTLGDLSRSGASAASAIPVYRDDEDAPPSDSGTDSEGEEFQQVRFSIDFHRFS